MGVQLEGDAYRFGIAPLKIEVLTKASARQKDLADVEELERLEAP